MARAKNLGLQLLRSERTVWANRLKRHVAGMSRPLHGCAHFCGHKGHTCNSALPFYTDTLFHYVKYVMRAARKLADAEGITL